MFEIDFFFVFFLCFYLMKGCRPRGPNPEKVGARIMGARKPEMGPRRVGASPKFHAFFSVSRSHFHSFCLSLGVFSWNFVVFGSAGALKCSRFEFSGYRVKPRRPQSRRGFTRQERNFGRSREGRSREGGPGKGGPGAVRGHRNMTKTP